MKQFFTFLLNLVLPPRCPYCGQIVERQSTLCPNCFEKIKFITAPYCKICGRPFESEKQTKNHFICPHCASHKSIIRMNRSAVLYDDFSKKAILSFKFSDHLQTAKLFAKWLNLAGKDIFDLGADLLIPVPLSFRRLIYRRYNQSALLAHELSKLTHIPVDVCSLKKIKNTKPQSLLAEKARLKNVKNAFELKKPLNIKGKRIVLIDDVMTTGATLSECAKVLLKNGAKSVDTLTIARVIKE